MTLSWLSPYFARQFAFRCSVELYHSDFEEHHGADDVRSQATMRDGSHKRTSSANEASLGAVDTVGGRVSSPDGRTRDCPLIQMSKR